MNEREECGTDGYCKYLTDRIQESNARVKGFVPINLVNLVTLKTRHAGICYKTSANDIGLMLNFCPFCGKEHNNNFGEIQE